MARFRKFSAKSLRKSIETKTHRNRRGWKEKEASGISCQWHFSLLKDSFRLTEESFRKTNIPTEERQKITKRVHTQGKFFFELNLQSTALQLVERYRFLFLSGFLLSFPNQCVIIGAGPCGLRTAVELGFMGARVVLVEKRDAFSRNNVLHLWPFAIHDLRGLGAKKFYGKFCGGSIDHISKRASHHPYPR